MLPEIMTCLSIARGITEGIAAVKEGAGDLADIMGRFGELNQKIQETEQKYEGKMSYRDALRLESIARNLKNFDTALKDACYLQQQPDLYHSIKARMQKADEAHAQKLKLLALRRKQREEELQQILQVVGWLALVGGLTTGGFILLIYL